MKLTPYYDDGLVTLYHGDCREVLPLLVPAEIVLTDPPYGIGVKYGTASNDSRKDYWPWMQECVTAMRAAAPVVVFTHRVRALEHITGWDWVGAWTKPLATGVRLGNSPVLPHWEPIFMYGIHTIGTVGRSFSPDVFNFNPERSSAHNGLKGRQGWASMESPDHPVPKPENLWRVLLRAFGQDGGTVLDPFAGSGTTLRVAKDEGRRAVGIEIEERYCEQIVRRLGQEVFDFGEVDAPLGDGCMSASPIAPSGRPS